LDVIGAVMTRLSGDLQVVVASRTGAGLPLALLRSQGAIAEFSIADLAMDGTEAHAVFEAAGVDPDGHIEAVMERSEGWPAGIYLSAMAIKAGSPGLEEVEVHGDDVFLADYLRDELLGQVSESLMDFLLRTSILTRLSGPLCDHVLDTTGSAERLAQLEQANLLIVPMDRTRTWFRYHSLLGDYLRSELEKGRPDGLSELHSRAATWFESHGLPDLAIDHVQLAGDEARFARMVIGSIRRVYAEGRVETISGWLTSLEESKELVHHPELAALGGFARALEGDAAGSERLGVHAFTDDQGNYLETDELGPFALMLRAVQAPRDPEQALADARKARSTFEATHVEWIHPCLGVEALATQAVKGLQDAEALWTDGLWRSRAISAFPYTSLSLAERALAAIDRDDWETAAEFIDESVDVIRASGLDGYITSALSFTLAARLQARKGQVDDALALLASAAAIRPRLTVAAPLLSVQNLHEMAKAFIEVGDVAGARRVIRDAADIIALRPRLGSFVSDHEALRATLAALPGGTVGASSLSKAELRLLPLLVTHLTYPEIGDRLYVSRHTVKTQAMSIYRKLGVSSRAEAVSKAREVGLISV
jgi:LuxR family maltose regulon positive regulatory protein